MKSYGYNYILLDDHYYLNYSAASQAFLNSWADEYASWGVDFLKIDAVGDWNQQDVQEWSTANGATVIQWSGPGGTNQQWSFVQG